MSCRYAASFCIFFYCIFCIFSLQNSPVTCCSLFKMCFDNPDDVSESFPFEHDVRCRRSPQAATARRTTTADSSLRHRAEGYRLLRDRKSKKSKQLQSIKPLSLRLKSFSFAVSCLFKFKLIRPSFNFFLTFFLYIAVRTVTISELIFCNYLF